MEVEAAVTTQKPNPTMTFLRTFFAVLLLALPVLAQTSPGARYANIATMVASGTSSTNRSAWTQGAVTANDGLGAFYVYDASYSGPTNTTTIVDASPGAGAWIATLGLGLNLDSTLSTINSLVGYSQPYRTIIVSPPGGDGAYNQVQDAINSITDSGPSKIYEIRVREGTYTNRFYNVGLQQAQWIRIIGDSQTGTIIHFTDTGTTGTNDTATLMGRVGLENLTLRRTVNGGSADYPLHFDSTGAGFTNWVRPIWYVKNVTLLADGTTGGSALGIGMHSGEVGYIINVTGVGDASRAINSHDENGSPAEPSWLYFVGGHFSTTASTPNNIGLYWTRFSDNTVPSYVIVSGGTYLGSDAGIEIDQGTSAGDTYVTVADNVVASSIVTANSEWLFRGNPIVPRAPNVQWTNEYTGTIQVSPTGPVLSESSLRPKGANAVEDIYLTGSNTNTLWGVPADGNARFTAVGNAVFSVANGGTTLGVGRGAVTPLTQMHVAGGSSVFSYPSITSSEETFLLANTASTNTFGVVLSDATGKAGFKFGDTASKSVIDAYLDNTLNAFIFDLPEYLKVQVASTGGTPNSNTRFLIESTGTTYAEVLVPNTNIGGFIVSDPDGSLRGAFRYNNNTDTADIIAGGSAEIQVTSAITTFLDDAQFNLTTTTTGTATFNGAANFNDPVTVSDTTILAPSSAQVLTAVTSPTIDATTITVTGSPGNVTLVNTPTIANGTDGQVVIIRGTSDSATVTFQDQANLANSGLRLRGVNKTVGLYDTLVLRYSSSGTEWVEVAYANDQAAAGTVTSVSAANFGGWFTGSVATPTTTPAISYVAIDQNETALIGYDNTANVWTNVLIGTGLTYTSATRTLTASSGVTGVAASAADVLGVSGSDITGDDPAFNSIVGWDNTDNKLIHYAPSAAFDMDAATDAIDIAVNGLTLDRLQQIPTETLLGRFDSGTGNVEIVGIGSGLAIVGTNLTATAVSGVTGVAASAGDILSVSGSDLVGDDAGFNSIVGWDNSDNKLIHYAPSAAFDMDTATDAIDLAVNGVQLDRLETLASDTIIGSDGGGNATELTVTSPIQITGGTLNLAAINGSSYVTKSVTVSSPTAFLSGNIAAGQIGSFVIYWGCKLSGGGQNGSGSGVTIFSIDENLVITHNTTVVTVGDVLDPVVFTLDDLGSGNFNITVDINSSSGMATTGSFRYRIDNFGDTALTSI